MLATAKLQLLPESAGVYDFPPLSAVRALNFVDFSASGVHVTAGQTLRLAFSAGPSPFTPFSFRDSADVYAGGAESTSSGNGPRDLCFQVYVDPSR